MINEWWYGDNDINADKKIKKRMNICSNETYLEYLAYLWIGSSYSIPKCITERHLAIAWFLSKRHPRPGEFQYCVGLLPSPFHHKLLLLGASALEANKQIKSFCCSFLIFGSLYSFLLFFKPFRKKREGNEMLRTDEREWDGGRKEKEKVSVKKME